MRISSLAALSAALGAALGAAAATFPAELALHNNSWRIAVEPETSTEVAPYSNAPVVIRDADQLARVLDNINVLNAMAQWPDGAGMFLTEPGGVDGDEPADAAAAAAAAAAADPAPERTPEPEPEPTLAASPATTAKTKAAR